MFFSKRSPSPWPSQHLRTRNFDPHFNPQNDMGPQPPLWARIITLLLSLVSLMYLIHCLTVRWSIWTGNLKKVPMASWFIFIIYISSICFILSSMIVKYAFGINSSFTACQTGVMLCLSFYLISKLLIYSYFTERSFLVWGGRGGRAISSKGPRSRYNNKLYIFNIVVIIGGYCAIAVLTYVYRIAQMSVSGFCLIGIKSPVSIVLVVYESAINLYLTFLFLLPFRKLYLEEKKEKVLVRSEKSNQQLRQMTIRCFMGAVGTCLTTGANLTAVAVLDGQQAWLCLTCCNLDLVICVAILHWVTAYGVNSGNNNNSHNGAQGPGSDPYHAELYPGHHQNSNRLFTPVSPRSTRSPSMKHKPRVDSLSSPFDNSPDRLTPVLGTSPTSNGYSYAKKPQALGKSDPYGYADFGLLTTISHISENDVDVGLPPPSSIAVKTGQAFEYEDIVPSKEILKQPSRMIPRSPVVGDPERFSLPSAPPSPELDAVSPVMLNVRPTVGRNRSVPWQGTSQTEEAGFGLGLDQSHVAPNLGIGMAYGSDEKLGWTLIGTSPGTSSSRSPR